MVEGRGKEVKSGRGEGERNELFWDGLEYQYIKSSMNLRKET